MTINLHDIKVTGVSIRKLLDLRIEGAVLEHSKVSFRALVEDGEEFLYQTPRLQKISISSKTENQEEILFTGLIWKISVESSLDTSIVQVEGYSYSKLLDLEKKSRSFQDASMLLSELTKSVLSAYEGSDFIFSLEDREIGKIFLQYEETDWEFLKRVYSVYALIITPCEYMEGLRLYTGIPRLGQKDISKQVKTIYKDMEKYYRLKANRRETNSSSFTRYEIESSERANLFSEIKIGENVFLVSQYSYDFHNKDLLANYSLAMADSLLVERQNPLNIIGIALQGKVRSVSGTKVRVQLQIDEEENAVHDFPYSTLSASNDGSGWYMMPEIGDDVMVYFPSKEEQDAIAISAVGSYGIPSSGSDRMADPNNRYLRTKSGQSFTLGTEGISFVNSDGSEISIGNDGDVTISAMEKLELVGTESVNIASQEMIKIRGKDEVSIQSKEEGVLVLSGDQAVLQGTEVNLEHD